MYAVEQAHCYIKYMSTSEKCGVLHLCHRHKCMIFKISKPYTRNKTELWIALPSHTFIHNFQKQQNTLQLYCS